MHSCKFSWLSPVLSLCISFRYNVDSRSCNISKHVSRECETQKRVLTEIANKCPQMYQTVFRIIYTVKSNLEQMSAASDYDSA